MFSLPLHLCTHIMSAILSGISPLTNFCSLNACKPKSGFVNAELFFWMGDKDWHLGVFLNIPQWSNTTLQWHLLCCCKGYIPLLCHCSLHANTPGLKLGHFNSSVNVREFDDSYTFIFAGDVIQVCASFSSKMITNKIHSTTIFHTLLLQLCQLSLCVGLHFQLMKMVIDLWLMSTLTSNSVPKVGTALPWQFQSQLSFS